MTVQRVPVQGKHGRQLDEEDGGEEQFSVRGFLPEEPPRNSPQWGSSSVFLVSAGALRSVCSSGAFYNRCFAAEELEELTAVTSVALHER